MKTFTHLAIRFCFSLSLYFFLPNFSSAASFEDSTIFNSQFEKRVFKKIRDSVDVPALDILISLNYTVENEKEIRKAFENIVIELKESNISSKKKKKQISTIYKKVHSNLLKKYIEDADFNQIFDKGEYNCVGATALYALLFDRFNIDFEIRETPTHVYLIADPKGNKILVESTLPQKGTFYFDARFKKEYIEQLARNKIISQEELSSSSVDILFDKYFDDNKIIDQTQLAALLYYNKGVTAFNSANYIDATSQLEKAHIIYPSNTVQYLYGVAAANLLTQQLTDKNYDPSLLAKFLNLNPKNAEIQQAGLEYFNTLSNELTINQPAPEKYKKFYSDFIFSLSDSIDADEYSQTYYKLLAYTEYMKDNYPIALLNLNYAHIANPENLEIQELIVSAAAKHIMTDRSHSKAIDSIEYYFDVFPFLGNNKSFQEYYSYCLMRITRENYLYGSASTAEEYLNKLESTLDNNEKYSYQEDYLIDTYSDVASYYLNKAQFTKAANQMERALKYAPESLLLKDRLKKIKTLNNNIRSNSSTTYYSAPVTLSREELFKEDIKKHFVACWSVTGVLDRDFKEVKKYEDLEIRIYKNKEVVFLEGGSTKKGKYSIRNKSRLLYLIPDKNKEDYTLYKIESISQHELVLRSFKDNKMTQYKIYLNKCGS